MKQLLTKTKLISIFILALFLGCDNDDNALLPQVLSSYTFTLDEDTGTVSFINISEKATSYEWDFGDGDTSTEINPVKTYGASGTYTVVLTASNIAGATSTFETDITITIPVPPAPLALPIDFDGTNVAYGDVVEDNIGFSVVANPETGNGNNTNVGQMETGGGQFQNAQFPLGTAVDFSGDDKTIQLEMFASSEVDVLVKFENGADGARDVEVLTTHTGSGWETLSFDFANDAVASFIDGDPQNGQALVPEGQYGKMILFIGFNASPGVEGTFFVDNITQTTMVPDPSGCTGELIAATTLPVDFEGCETFLSSENFGDGITSELVENPFKTGINTSDFVLQVDKPTGSSFFAGIQNTFENNFDLTTTDVFRLKVYSTKANVVFRFELALNPQTDPVTGNPAPVFVTIPNANEWTEVEFSFTGLPGGPTAYNQLVIKPDNDMLDSPISEDGTYYIDDLTLGASGGGGGASLDDCGGDLVNDFETADDTIFDNFGGGVGTIIDNPDTSVNTSANVGQYVKNAGEVFGGITIAVDPDIDFDSGVFSIDVYSEAVRQLLFKLEGLNIEVVVPTSGTGWETLTYDFSAVGGNVGTVTAVTLIMDNGTQGEGTADWTIQFDNIRLCSNNAGGGGGLTPLSSLPADFEGGEEFGGVFEPTSVNGSIISNPVSGGINTSANVYEFNKPVGTEFYGGMENVFATPLDMTTTRAFRVKIYSSKPNIVVQFELQSRPNPGSIPNYSIQQTVTNANEWVELTFDFGAIVPPSFDPNIYNAIVIIPDFDPGNNPTSSSETYYIDDVILE